MATLRNHRNFWLRDDAAAAFDRAEADHGVFIVNSAGRTVAEQQSLIDRWNRGGAANRPPYLYKPAMPAPTSNHVRNGGVAVDLADWRRFAQICGQYGFKHSYPDSDPVHFDYVGGSGGGNATPNATIQAQQNWLISRGYDLGPTGADGIAGPKYAAAVQKYQTFLRAYGYTGDIDGIWGPGTQTAHQKYYDQVNNPTPVNEKVKREQTFLISRGYDLGPTGADGIAGPKYVAAVKAYQTFLRKYGYTGDIDGQWGDGTQAAHEKFYAELHAPSTGAPAFPLPAGKWFGPEGGGENSISGWHSYNAEFRVFQQRMKDRGWPITVDGLYGPKGAKTPQGNTAEVVVAFQKEKGLTPDGLVGPKTWEAAWTAPITPAPPTPEQPKPTEPTAPSVPDDEAAATPNLITPTAADFPSWIRFETVLDSDGQAVDHNKKFAEYYGKPYNPVESHIHWWGEPGKGGSHDGNVSYIRNTKDLSVNFVVSAGRVTLMVPLNKVALTTGQRNPFAWKSENDPTITDLSNDELGYRTMGFLHYLVEKLNPKLLNEPIRLHKEFYATSCSGLDKAKVRAYAEKFRTGALDPKTGKPPVVTPPVDPKPDPEQPLTVQVNKDFYDNVLKKLPAEFRALADDLDEGLA